MAPAESVAEPPSSQTTGCPNCGRVVVPGSIHCIKCGFLLDAPADDPDRPLKKIFKWWLLFYGFWRLVGAALSGLAALGSPSGSDASLVYSGLFLLSALSLFSIAMLWKGRQWALFVFICAELFRGFLELLLGNFMAPIYSIIAIAIMSFVSVRAKFQRA